jgi:hypothetical protein
VTKLKNKKPVVNNMKPEDGENPTQDEEQTECDEYVVEEDDDEEAEVVEEDE